MFGSNSLVPIEVVPDPFRSLHPAMPTVVTGSFGARERRHAWQAETVTRSGAERR